MSATPSPDDLSFLWEQVRVNPNLALAYLNLGKALEAHDRPIAALRSYQQAVELRPNYAEAQFRLGRQWWQRGDLDQARSHLQQAETLRVPGVPLALHFNQDLVYGHHGMRDPWFLWDGSVYRLYYLAGRWDEPSRSIHTAHSRDFATWHYDGTILTAADNRTSFGCGMTRVVDGSYRLFVTQRQQTDDGDRETILLLTSRDGYTWTLERDNTITPDPEHYAPHHWHHPSALLDPKSKNIYVVTGASAIACDDPNFQACVGLAVGDNGYTNFQALPPLLLQCADGGRAEGGRAGGGLTRGRASAFGQIDRPQLLMANDRYYLLFSCPSHRLHPDWRSRLVPRRLSESSIFCYVADEITGPYAPLPQDEPFLWGSERTRLARAGMFHDSQSHSTIVYGHYPQSQLLEVTKRFPVGWNGEQLGILFPSQEAKPTAEGAK